MVQPLKPASLGLSGPVNFDRRVDVRYELENEQATPRILDRGEPPCSVRMQNLSAGGLAFLAERRIEPHTLLSVDLPCKDQFGSRRLVMRVRTAELWSAGVWKIGCEFSRPLTSLEILALL
jgi:hypothetical protein